jgi:hypothetical protein
MSDLIYMDSVRVIARPGITGTFIRYYAPLSNGTRNVQIRWDDPSLAFTVNETQIAVLA